MEELVKKDNIRVGLEASDWKEAIQVAADYTAECIRLTLQDSEKPWYGVNFEQAIPFLLKRLGK